MLGIKNCEFSTQFMEIFNASERMLVTNNKKKMCLV